MRSDWLKRDSMDMILAALMPANRAVLEVCLQTGLRVGDVLAMRVCDLKQRMYVKESKTTKVKRIYLPAELLHRLEVQAGKKWVFEGRNDWRKHRTRQAVYKDIVRVAAAFRANGAVARGQVITPHTARKMYAVEEMRKTGDIAAVGRRLNHAEQGQAVTMLYAIADVLTARKQAAKGGKGGGK